MADDNFLGQYTIYNQHSESPSLFTLWCGFAGVSAVLGRRVWLDMGRFTIFPNMYTVLVAGSGRCRKSTSINQIEELLRLLEPPPNLIAQKITPEALIDAMRIKEINDKSQLLREKSEGFVIVDELATFLNKHTYEAGLGALLIPFYDCRPSFEYRTKGGGSQKLTNVCLGMLGASTVDWLTNAIPENAVGGGLTSRIMFIYVQEPPPPVAWPQTDPRLKEQLVLSLQRLSTLEGPFNITRDAINTFTKLYENWYSRSPFYDNKNLAGYASRRHVHLLKLAMILSAAETGPKLLLTQKHLEGAELQLEMAEKNMPLVLDLVTSSESGSNTHSILELIRRQKKVPRQQLVTSFSNKLSVRELDMYIETLMQSGRISHVIEGGNIYYVPTGR